ncbi:DnaJ C-terminal domain-containing protein [Zavarzinia sp. CC-PAN008]|uniref:DnaJ C-terminal domain-containing protein n=1 Tax=Zavarzinia sp. CC-PAN008 TaxID=3243332 RepID=UPI003F7422C3
MDDPYKELGVDRSADADAIRAAYRKLAKKFHPDLNPGNKRAEERFKAVNAANDLLSDPEKKARFDRGEIDASGQEKPQAHFYRGFGEGPGGAKYRAQGMGAEDLDDLLSGLFGGRRAGGFQSGGFQAGGPQGGPRMEFPGQDVHLAVEISLEDAATGAERTLRLPEGRTLRVAIPAGARNGQTLRLRGQGEAGFNGGPQGDAYVELRLAPHPAFRLEGDDVHSDLAISLAQAILGAKVPVPTLHGAVTLSIPANSNTGKTLRLRGRGWPRAGGSDKGDHYVTLKVMLPDPPDADLNAFVAQWAGGQADTPRTPQDAAP